MAGRVLRPFEGKERAVMLDHSGPAKRLGFPTDDLPLVLDDGKPRESVAHEAKEKLPKMCVKCSYMKPVGVHQCPKCGFLPERKNEVETADGELVRLERKKKRELSTEEKWQLFAELKTYAKDKGYRSGWAANQFKERTGVWPNYYRDVEPRPIRDETRSWIKSRQIAYAKAREA
jgi:superfamily II DNA or RNA helicase